MVIGGYFDESVRDDGTAPIVVGGFLFKPTQYKRFRERWHREVLRLPDRRRLKHFHMTDLCAGKGVYRGLAIDERSGVLRRAVNVICACAYGGLGVKFQQVEYEALAPPEWATYRGSIYAQACGLCVQIASYQLKEWRCPSMEVLYVFERGHKFQSEANDILMAYARHEATRKQLQYRNHLFEEKEKEFGLQAADLFAWSMTKAASIDGGEIPRAFRPFVADVVRLSSVMKDRLRLTILTGDMLRRYLMEQADLARGLIPVHFREGRKASLR
jgi:hypothetical protein